MKRFTRIELTVPQLTKDEIDVIKFRYIPQIEKFRQQKRPRDVERFEGIALDEVRETNASRRSDAYFKVMQKYLTPEQDRAVVLIRQNDVTRRILEIKIYRNAPAKKLPDHQVVAQMSIETFTPAYDLKTFSLTNRQLQVDSRAAILTSLKQAVHAGLGASQDDQHTECYCSSHRVNPKAGGQPKPADSWSQIGGPLAATFITNWLLMQGQKFSQAKP